MSFVLRPGFRLDAGMSLEAAYDWADGLRPEIAARAARRDAEILAEHAARRLDLHATLSLRPGEVARDPCNPLGEADDRIRERRRQIRVTGYRDAEVDFDISVTLHPHRGRIHGICHSEQDDWIRLVLDQALVEPLPYWDNTDRPDHLEAADWRQRGETWDAILGRDRFHRPSHCGLTVEMTPFPVPPSVEEVVAAQPSFETRLRTTARDCAIHARADAGRQDDPDAAMRAVIAAISSLDGAEGQALIAKMTEKCSDLILPRIEKDHLLGETG